MQLDNLTQLATQALLLILQLSAPMVGAAALFVPGAFVTLTLVRRIAGPPN